MKKLFLILSLLTLCFPVFAKEWYVGGTLEDKTMAEWNKATQENKLATCGNWISKLDTSNQLNEKITQTIRKNMLPTIKALALNCVAQLDEAYDPMINKDKAFLIFYMVMTLEGWLK